MSEQFEFVPKHYASRPHEKMQEVLMNPNGQGPSIHYYMIRGGNDQRNITVWEPGTISGEYIKTYGHYHVGDLKEWYWILHGEGVALLQIRARDENGKEQDDVVEKFRAIVVRSGDSVFMESGWGHLVVNTGSTFLVTADDSPVDFGEKDPVGMPGHADYEAVKKMRGFAFYVVNYNGKPALVKNPLYKNVKEVDSGGLEIISDYPKKS